MRAIFAVAVTMMMRAPATTTTEASCNSDSVDNLDNEQKVVQTWPKSALSTQRSWLIIALDVEATDALLPVSQDATAAAKRAKVKLYVGARELGVSLRIY